MALGLLWVTAVVATGAICMEMGWADTSPIHAATRDFIVTLALMVFTVPVFAIIAVHDKWTEAQTEKAFAWVMAFVLFMAVYTGIQNYLHPHVGPLIP